MPVRPPTFRPKGARDRRQTNAESDARRGSARERGYDTAWDKAANGFKRSHPLCLGCEAVGRLKAATLVDHIVPHKGDQSLFWDKANWQPSCQPHHDVVKQRLEALFTQGRIKACDLHFDSETAKAMTIDLMGEGGG